MWAVLGVVVGIAGSYLFVQLKQSEDLGPSGDVRAQRVQIEQQSTGISPAADEISDYATVRDQYADRRIQVDNCALLPNRVTYKNGTTIMIDNRSPDGQELRIDGQVFPLSGYEYRIVTLSHNSLPYLITVDCVTQGQPLYNAGQILLQP